MSQDLVRTAMTTGDQLDDLARARIWNSVEDRLGEPMQRARWPLAALAACATVAVIAVLVLRGSAGSDATLVVASDATLTSPIGPHTRTALVGPAELDVVGAPGDATTIRLRTGTLVAEFTGGPGRTLRIEAPGAVIDVIGTVFAIEARVDETCISVLHGRVRVNLSIELGTGASFCTGSGARAIDPDIRDAMERHERTLTARTATTRAPNAVADDVAKAASTMQTTHAPTTHAPTTNAPTTNAPTTNAPTTNAPTTDRRAKTQAGHATNTQAANAQIAQTTTAQPTDAQPTDAQPTDAPATDTPATDTPATETKANDAVDIVIANAKNLPNATETKRAVDPPKQVDAPKPKPPATADELYQAAEAALAARDPQAADRALEQLIARHPSSPLVEQALYDRARIAHQRRSWAAARQHVDRLLALPSGRLGEQARYLACRIAVETTDAGAASCLIDYRKAYPRSPHDRDVLGLLVQLDHANGGCRVAASRIAELVRAYPNSKLASAWRTRCGESR